ncbi:MAG: lytic transglycosylase domain-containing protein [Rickettsiales bacterium]|nr:lytic transglycosylase domain-containing protein [Rickettsiales bacterium]
MIRLLLLFWLLSYSAIAVDHSDFIKSIDNKKWAEAKKNNPKLETLVTWLELYNENNPSFYQLRDFIKKHPNWPKIYILRQKIEESDFTSVKDVDALAWFNANPPITNNGKKKYITLLSDGKKKTRYIKEVWKEAVFSQKDEKQFLKLYGNVLVKTDHIARLDYMLFNKNPDQAKRLLHYVSKEALPLYKARISIQKGDNYTIKKYKDSQKYPGILYDIARFYNNKNDENSLIQILKSSSKIRTPYQRYFWTMKTRVIRDLIIDSDYNSAYLFASSHGNISSSEYSDAEWLSGWIALRFLNKPKLAITHFNNMYKKVKRPISVSRAAYWLARSYEKLQDNANSNYWYEVAAKYYTSFYGQLAVCKINDCQVNIPDDPEPTPADKEHFKNNILVNAALVLHESKKYNNLVQSFITKAIDNSRSLAEIALITKLGFELNHHHLSVEAAKHASYRDIHIIHSNYPILESVYKEHRLDPALVMSLIRQESVFNHRAVSSAGAMGLMQLMPFVAKEAAADLKIKYRKDKLLSDPHFNTQLGTAHLNKLTTCYNPSYILSIAAYNAGDKAVQRWLDNNGDPRLMEDKLEDIIDWMERISFHETRNYVQRVLEGKSIYHLLMDKNKTKLSIMSDLTYGSGEDCPVN